MCTSGGVTWLRLRKLRNRSVQDHFWIWLGTIDFPSRSNEFWCPTNESDKAIESGVVLAKLFGARLTLLHAYQDPYYAVEYLLGPHAQDPALQDQTYFENALKTVAQGVRKEYPDCDIEFRDGEPCKEIVLTAKERDIDLIIISTHHYNWLTRLAFGCDAEQILRHAPCPILILPAK